MVESCAFSFSAASALRAAPSGLPVFDHRIEIVDEQRGRRLQVIAAAIAISVRAILQVIIGGRPLACAGPRAVEILSPKQEFDRVITGTDVGLDFHRAVELGDDLLVDLAGVERLGAEANFFVGNDVRRVEGIFSPCVAVAALIDIVDQTFVERPRVDVAFPVVDDLVAEAVAFCLHVGNAGGFPRLARRLQC